MARAVDAQDFAPKSFLEFPAKIFHPVQDPFPGRASENDAPGIAPAPTRRIRAPSARTVRYRSDAGRGRTL
jgi:hypothetical protein